MLDIMSVGDLLLGALGLLLILASIIRYELATADPSARRSAFILLLVGAFGLRLFVARLDPYLNLWDEQFHALVAKNLISHPLRPTLYERPLLPFDIWDWTHKDVWLHKQPLFLWQIALSLRLFGVNELAVRLPSVFLSTAVLAIIQRVGTLTVSARAGFYGALLAASGWFGLDLVAGHALTDHNDVAFLFYVAASLWAWVEMSRSPTMRWAVLVGVFAGLAVLVKWLAGLIVFSGWALALVTDRSARRDRHAWGRLVLGLVVTATVVLPWQIYILRVFPEEARWEYALNMRHIHEALEGHEGGFGFHWRALRDLYGNSPVVPPLAAGSLLLLAIRMPRRDHRVALLTWIVAVYAFFTAAATKMTAYCYPVSPLLYLAFGATLESALLWLTHVAGVKRAWAARSLSIVVLLLSAWSVSVRELAYHHTNRKLDEKPYRAVRMRDTEIIRRLPEVLPSGRDWAVFNCREHEGILVMFHTPYIGYDVVPTPEQLATLQAKGVAVAVFTSPDLPDYLAQDPTVFKVRPSVWDGPLGQVRGITN
jgi:4-amino-4-deoxy-L-arabinose transferase-like glycosyltransferase